MNRKYKHEVIAKSSSSQIDAKDPIFYGYIYSEEGDRNQHKEKFVDFKNLSHFNEHLSALGKDSNNDENMSIFDILKKDFPSEKRIIIDRTPTPYPKTSEQIKMKKKDPIKKIKKKKNKKSKHRKKTKKSKLRNTSKKHTKKKK